MATSNQRRKERRKQKRKRQEKKKRAERRQRIAQDRPVAIVPPANARHRERLARQQPVAWQGELVEDVAVFDDAALASLSSEKAAHVSAVREAIQLATAGRGQEAIQRTAEISRSSPLSEWRLMIRGYAAWSAGEIDAANRAWRRLDAERRPGRIAIVLATSLRDDLERAKPGRLPSQGANKETATPGEASREASAPGGSSDDGASIEWSPQVDEQLLYHAKLLRRVRFDRGAIRVAEAGVRVREEKRDLLIGPKKIEWLRDFAREYRATEPGLVASLERTALERAAAQPYSDLFESTVAAIPGPRHDPANRLSRFFYYLRFSNDRRAARNAEQSLDRYLKTDLPQNEALSKPLRQAIASQIYLNEARAQILPRRDDVLNFLVDEGEDAGEIRRLLKAAVKAYPKNRAAYKTHADWIESKLDDDRLTKPKRKPLEKELTSVMQAWAKGLPDDVKPRLWLVDHLLEEEQTEMAKPHVEWLADARQNDPRVRAAPWKWQMLEAMRLSRRKAWLADVPAALDAAESLWPSWLDDRWLAYLRAAYHLRAGETEAYEEQRQRICGESGVARDSLPDACMMLGAAQRMRTPAADLKPLRAPIDEAVQNVTTLSYEELLGAGSFFWDLHRTGLQYPAYRMHGGKFARELWDRFLRRPDRICNHANEEQIPAAVLWCFEFRPCDDGYRLKLPPWFDEQLLTQQPKLAAAKLSAFLKLGRSWEIDDYRDLGPQLREAARAERDPYYRDWFISLADELDELALGGAEGGFGSGYGPFAELLGQMFAEDDAADDWDDDESDELDEDEFLDFDPECDCPSCRAAQKAYRAANGFRD